MKLDEVTSQSWNFIIDRPEKQKQGIYLYYKGVPSPRRVYYDKLNDPNHDLRALEALGRVKKFLFTLTYLSDLVIPRRLKLERYALFLERLLGVCNWQLGEYLVKDDEWSVPVWEIGKFVKAFLLNLGFTDGDHNGWLVTGWSKVIMAILEYDNAYRYRVQDLLGEITHLDRGTLKYIMVLYKEREGMFGAAQKIDKITRLLSWLLWIPKIKNALEKANESIDFKKIALDVNDRYHTSFWRGYDYGGKSFDERYQFFLDTHKDGFPPYIKRKDPNETAKFMTE